MNMLAKVNDNGFVVSIYLATEFANQGPNEFIAPSDTCPPQMVWRRVENAWVLHPDRRGQMFYDPSSEKLSVFTITELIQEPPEGWLPYGEAQRLQEGLERAWELVRLRRGSLLATSDWTDTLSAKHRLGDALYNAWQAYRQALRDVTNQPDPLNIVWPIQP